MPMSWGGLGGYQDAYIGDEAISKRGILTLRYPIEHGIVTNWDDMEKIWHHTFYNELRVAPEEHPVLLTESPFNPKANREKMTQIMFETFEVPALYIIAAPVLSIIATETITGLVIDLGFGATTITPIYQGYVINHAVNLCEIGGNDITEYLMKLLTEKGYSLTTSTHRDLVENLKETHACVAVDQNSISDDQIEFEFYNGDVISIGKERYLCAEPIFDPEHLGMEVDGLARRVVNTILKCSPDIRGDMFSNIVLSGGTSLLPGLRERLRDELVSLKAVTHYNLKITVPDQYSAWIGGSILSTMPCFSGRLMTRAEYDLYGPSIVHRWCF